MKLSYPSNKICPKCGTGGYVWYLEGSEYVAKCANCGHYFRKEDFPMCVLDGVPKPKTNGDKIRAMKDEELARFLYIKTCEDGYPQFDTILSWLNWLKKEAE